MQIYTIYIIYIIKSPTFDSGSKETLEIKHLLTSIQFCYHCSGKKVKDIYFVQRLVRWVNRCFSSNHSSRSERLTKQIKERILRENLIKNKFYTKLFTMRQDSQKAIGILDPAHKV